MQIDADEYPGKFTESGASLEILGNLLVNVKTMLKMICPTFTLPNDAIKIFSLIPMPARILRAQPHGTNVVVP